MFGVLSGRLLVPQIKDAPDAFLGGHGEPEVSRNGVHFFVAPSDASGPRAAAHFGAWAEGGHEGKSSSGGLLAASREGQIGIGAAGSPRRTPPTPPDVRVRIRRFGELRLRGKPWDAEVVEVARGQGDVDLPA
jgi:hypothetical protein